MVGDTAIDRLEAVTNDQEYAVRRMLEESQWLCDVTRYAIQNGKLAKGSIVPAGPRDGTEADVEALRRVFNTDHTVAQVHGMINFYDAGRARIDIEAEFPDEDVLPRGER